MKLKYKTKWKSGSLNKRFWCEVLQGKTITSLKFDDEGIYSFTLDSGQEVILLGDSGRLMIEI